MAILMAVSSLLPTTTPMAAPFKGSYGMNLKGRTVTSERVFMAPRHCNGKWKASLVCTSREPISIAALSNKNQYSALKLDDFSFRGILDRGTTPVRPRHRALRTVISNASKEMMPSAWSAKEYPIEKKPRWWWRTLACIPYLMPLHVMSVYAEGAHQFLPFLQNFEILTDPFFGNQLPSWFMIVYCLGVYFLVVRRKRWPHFFRFHVIMAMLLDNAIQIMGIVVGWMPYWSKIDAPFWTVFACGLLIVLFGCIRGALKGTYADAPFFSEAAFIHTYLP